MERTVPRTETDEIELYIRTYYSLLRSSGEVAIDALVESHIGMDSLLHSRAGAEAVDISALVYSSLRLPLPIIKTRLILLGQRSGVFERWGYPVTEWQEVRAKARRRRTFYDGDETLAMYITSRSDIDDLIPILTAFQIEWNKLHRVLRSAQGRRFVELLEEGRPLDEDELATLAAACGVEFDDIIGLHAAWGENTVPILRGMAAAPKRFAVRQLAGSLVDYQKAMRYWWVNLRKTTPEIDYDDRRVYFVSSNTHSIVNMWSGYALRKHDMLLDYIRSLSDNGLLAEYNDIQAKAVPSSRENFFYYALKKYLQAHGPEANRERAEEERAVGIRRITSENGGFELDAQVIHLDQVNPDRIDPRLCTPDIDLLKRSGALIVNIDYPLGFAAYEMLARVAENVGRLSGVYVMGKSATLNGRIGDILLPIVVHDEFSRNTYLFDNCFNADDVSPYLGYGTVLDNQKSVSVQGTFLQNDEYMGVFYREGYTDIEMEAGPYLSAAYEMIRPTRHPHNEIVSLHPARFDIGILHYASDKPLSKGKNLGAGSLSYRGMDPTYAAAVAILRRIITQEVKLIQQTIT